MSEKSKSENSSIPRRASRSRVSKPSLLSKLLGGFGIGRVLKEIITNSTLRGKVLITVFIIAIFRSMAAIPLPGIDMNVFQDTFSEINPSEANILFSAFTGGQLDSPSVVGLGIAAFINASIIMQLMTPVIPKLHELSKEGQSGTQRIQQYTRYLTLPLAFFYSIAYIILMSRRDLNSPDPAQESANPAYLVARAESSDWPSIGKILFMALVLTAGSMIVMWLAENITEKGIGNGSSIMIGIGILAALPGLIRADFAGLDLGNLFSSLIEGTLDVLLSPEVLVLVGLIIGALLVIVSIVFVDQSSRKLPIQYARRLRGSEGENSNFPIKMTVSGVMPIIFGSALLAMPQVFVPLIQSFADSDSWLQDVSSFLEGSFLYASQDNFVNMDDFWYGLTYFLLVLIFSLFYATIVIKPNDAAENLQKQGGFIPGIRPGESTANYITSVLMRISFVGGIFLGLIALIPLVARNLILLETNINMQVLSGIGGTSILIIISVLLDIVRQYKSMRVSKSYERYVR